MDRERVVLKRLCEEVVKLARERDEALEQVSEMRQRLEAENR